MTRKTWFWNLIAKKYARDAVANQKAYQHKLDVTQQYLNQDTRVFEMGCGTGTTALYHAPRAHSVVATDIAENMIRIAKQKAENQEIKNVHFSCSAIEDIRYEPASFDMVMAHSILHLVEDKDQALATAYKMLKPGGVLISSTACVQEIAPLLKIPLTIGSFLGILPLVKFFTKQNLVQSVEKAQFTIEQCWQPSPKEAVFIVAKKPLAA